MQYHIDSTISEVESYWKVTLKNTNIFPINNLSQCNFYTHTHTRALARAHARTHSRTFKFLNSSSFEALSLLSFFFWPVDFRPVISQCTMLSENVEYQTPILARSQVVPNFNLLTRHILKFSLTFNLLTWYETYAQYGLKSVYAWIQTQALSLVFYFPHVFVFCV